MTWESGRPAHRVPPMGRGSTPVGRPAWASTNAPEQRLAIRRRGRGRAGRWTGLVAGFPLPPGTRTRSRRETTSPWIERRDGPLAGRPRLLPPSADGEVVPGDPELRPWLRRPRGDRQFEDGRARWSSVATVCTEVEKPHGATLRTKAGGHAAIAPARLRHVDRPGRRTIYCVRPPFKMVLSAHIQVLPLRLEKFCRIATVIRTGLPVLLSRSSPDGRTQSHPLAVGGWMERRSERSSPAAIEFVRSSRGRGLTWKGDEGRSSAPHRVVTAREGHRRDRRSAGGAGYPAGVRSKWCSAVALNGMPGWGWLWEVRVISDDRGDGARVECSRWGVWRWRVITVFTKENV